MICDDLVACPGSRRLTPARREERLEEDWKIADESDLEVSVILGDMELALEQAGGELVPDVADVRSKGYGELGFIARADVALFSVLLASVPREEAIEVARHVRASLAEAFPDAVDHIVLGVTAKTESGVEDVEAAIAGSDVDAATRDYGG